MGLGIASEVGKLNTVLLHKPGHELDNLTPSIMERLLFDDIPDYPSAGREFDCFIEHFRNAGTEVLFYEELFADVLADNELKRRFIEEYLEPERYSVEAKAELSRYYESITTKGPLVGRLISGLRREELPPEILPLFVQADSSPDPLIIDPLPNLYFTRDPAAMIGKHILIGRMFSPARRKESLIARYIFENHPRFVGELTVLDSEQLQGFIEGGDIIVLSERVLAVGLSQRTDRKAIESLARLLFEKDEKVECVLILEIPSRRAFMHLDTVFTQIDRDLFVIHPAIEAPLKISSLTYHEGAVVSRELTGRLEDILCESLGLDEIEIIRCGGGSGIDAEREQWNDGSNTLAIAPREIIVYDRNRITNRLFEEAGIRMHSIPSSEISRGRGGPRCMSMPLSREELV